MVVVVLTACLAGLRGYLTRWLLEISPGVFTGVVSARVRDLMWSHVVDLAKDGRAIMVYSAKASSVKSSRCTGMNGNQLTSMVSN